MTELRSDVKKVHEGVSNLTQLIMQLTNSRRTPADNLFFNGHYSTPIPSVYIIIVNHKLNTFFHQHSQHLTDQSFVHKRRTYLYTNRLQLHQHRQNQMQQLEQHLIQTLLAHCQVTKPQQDKQTKPSRTTR